MLGDCAGSKQDLETVLKIEPKNSAAKRELSAGEKSIKEVCARMLRYNVAKFRSVTATQQL